MHKKYILWRLERLIKKYFKRHNPKLIVITGSVGKTSTKLAIATVLSTQYTVRVNQGNHNMQFSVPLSILGVDYPDDPHSILQWLQVIRAMKTVIKNDDIQVIVQELGTDSPGDIAHFGTYLKPDIAVITAVSPEHMENFPTLDDVAKEELAIAEFSGLTVINRDDVDAQYAQYAKTTNITTYGLSQGAEYRIDLHATSPLDAKMGTLHSPEWGETSLSIQLVGNHSVKIVGAAAAVAAKLGMSPQNFANGVAKVSTPAGRMSLLRGASESIIIDDSYNSSPKAAIAAIETLKAIDAPQRIAILGSMNELGNYSEEAHRKVGSVCDNQLIDWVVTIGEDAAKYLAPAAYDRGCRVKSFRTPYEAGGFVRQNLQRGAVTLVKGSQNNIFAEEAIKVILHDASDEKHLVRQTAVWLDKKRACFDQAPQETSRVM